MSFIDDAAGDGAPEGVDQNPPELSQHAQQFLGNVPDEHKAIVDQYVRQWDSGFTKYSQQVQNELKGYKDLGDPTTLSQARELYNQFLNDPASVAEFLVQQGFYTPQAPVETPQTPEIPAEIAQFLNPIQEKLSKFDDVQKAVQVMAAQFQQQEAARKQAEEDAALEKAIGTLKEKHGDFDMEYVLTKAQSNGGDLEAAVQAYKRFEQNLINRGASAPKVMGGTSLPGLTKSPADMSTEERQSILLAKLSGLRQG